MLEQAQRSLSKFLEENPEIQKAGDGVPVPEPLRNLREQIALLQRAIELRGKQIDWEPITALGGRTSATTPTGGVMREEGRPISGAPLKGIVVGTMSYNLARAKAEAAFSRFLERHSGNESEWLGAAVDYLRTITDGLVADFLPSFAINPTFDLRCFRGGIDSAIRDLWEREFCKQAFASEFNYGRDGSEYAFEAAVRTPEMRTLWEQVETDFWTRHAAYLEHCESSGEPTAAESFRKVEVTGAKPDKQPAEASDPARSRLAATPFKGFAEGAMVVSNCWRDLEAQFRALDPSGILGVRCHYKTGNQGRYDYQITGADDGARLNFERLARLAGAALCPGRDCDSLHLWLDTLRERCKNIESGDPVPLSLEEAFIFERIGRACEESANLCVRLAIEAFETDRQGTRTMDTTGEANHPEAGPTASGTNPAESHGKGRKRGPKPDHEAASRVAEIVARVASNCEWRSKLNELGEALAHGVCSASDPEICDVSDHEKVPLPRGWKLKGHNWLNPPDRATMVKAIEYRLEIARKKPTNETLS